MQKTAEAVSLGHPDKTADYISSYILDRLIEQDPRVHYAVEVMVKDNTVILGGEVGGRVDLTPLNTFVADAVRDIGYDERYADLWGMYALNVRRLQVVNLIGCQSGDINRGVVQNGWGDQGVFVGYACPGEGFINRELGLARRLNRALYNRARSSENLGLDIKTQITLADDGHIQTAIAAVPMLKPENLDTFICQTLGATPDQIIVNGTGAYQYHSSVADCGITGRKLACDFYSTACPIGGGSPWTKDASKADLTLNLYARRLALQYLGDNDECFVFLSSCIGRSEMPGATVKTIKDGHVLTQNLHLDQTPEQLIDTLHLRQPVFAKLCANGLV